MTGTNRGNVRTLLKLALLLLAVLVVVLLYNNRNTLTPNIVAVLADEKVLLVENEEIRLRNAFLEIRDLPLQDPKLLEYLRLNQLVPPSQLPYALTKRSVEFPTQFGKELQDIFGDKKDGFFIECGANDGEFLSNTLELEKRGWTGLLVEAQPELGQRLLTKNRKAWFANVCLSPFRNISEIEFAVGNGDAMQRDWGDAVGHLVLPDNKNEWYHRKYGAVPCFPLSSLLAAMGVTHVDYLTLDVEGVELKVLKTLPFDDSLVIDYIQVETNHLPEGEKGVKEFLNSKGYDFLLKSHLDAIFKRRT